jgi:glycosyltransferase involved in cell wall biosynthesis
LNSLDSSAERIEEVEDSILFCTNSFSLQKSAATVRDITLFIACYNEEENVLATFEAITSALSTLELSWEIIVIDDASTDKTVELVKSYMTANPGDPVLLVCREVNQGVAQNYVDAAFLGTGKYYRLINGDNVENSQQISTILSHVGEADLIIPTHEQTGSRTMFRRILSSTFTHLVNVISGYRINYYNGCTVHLRYDVMRWHSDSQGFDFQADFITKLLDKGRTYLEVSTVCGEREFGQSKALTLKNLVSSVRFFINLCIRRFNKAVGI